MAKTVAKPAHRPAQKPAATKVSGKAGGLLVTFALFLGAVMVIAALPLVVLIVAGMMPTAAVSVIDRRPRYLTYTVGMLNFAGVTPFLLIVAKHDMTMIVAVAKLAEPLTWIVMYGAAAAGWLISGATPTLARAGIELQAFQRRRALEALGKAIREEWGDEVASERDR